MTRKEKVRLVFEKDLTGSVYTIYHNLATVRNIFSTISVL